VTTKCPHAHIRFCPLYIASHGLQHPNGQWLGCHDGKENGSNGCGIARKVNYHRMLQLITEADPLMVAETEFKEAAFDEWEEAQRRRAARLRMLH
jgi:hypothetical protein